MKKLSEEKLVDYVDGALTPEERAHVEAYLRENPEEAELVELMRLAMPAVKDWHESEPLRVSENFWPELRDKLGPVPQRSLRRRLFLFLFPPAVAVGAVEQTSVSHSGASAVVPFVASRSTRLSLGVAAVALALTLGVFWFAPKGAIVNPVAITDADRNFMKTSRERHEAYLRSQPVAPGDSSVQESGADDVEEETNP